MEPEAERSLVLKSRLPLYLIGVLVFLQLVVPDRTWMYLLAGLGSMVGLAYWWTREMRDKVRATRASRGNWIVVGDRLEERFQLINRSVLPVLWATVEDHSQMPGYAINRMVAVDGRGRFSWQTQGLCSKRGVFTLGPWTLTLGDPFGLFEVTLRYPEERTILVYPRIMHLPEIQLPQGRASGRARRTLPANTDSVLASSVRPYVPGDSLRLIHWRKTAQQGALMFKQFDLEPAGDLWLALDLNSAVQVGEGQENTLEYGVILAASLAAKHLDENRAVGLILFGAEPRIIPPQAGTAQLWGLLHELAHAEASAQWSLAEVLKQVAPDIGRGRTLLVITPSTAPTWLGELARMRRRDVAPAALLIDAASFQDSADARVFALQGLLADQNIPTYIIAKGYPFHPLVTFKRKRQVLKTLPGTGRVISIEVEEEV